jgi:hypothetical protein
MADDGFDMKEWEEFVENFSKFVDNWEAKKAVLLNRMAGIYLSEVMPLVPADTSRLVGSISVFGEGIPQDYIEVGTNVEYALYVNDGHVQHKRFLPAERLSVGGRAKYLKNKDQKGIMLSERYVQGKYFFEKGRNASKPRWERLVNSFMKECKREIEGGSV